MMGFLRLVFPASAAVPDGAKTEPKTHTLFMGADVSIEQNTKLYRVQDVVGGSFVIIVDGKEVKVPADFGAIKLKVDRSLKLTVTSALIDHLKAERAYTPENDPGKKFMVQQGQAIGSQAAIAQAGQEYRNAQTIANSEKKYAIGGVAAGRPSLGANPALAEQKYNAAYAASLSDFGNNGALVGKMQDELKEGLFDAMDVEFAVSSEKLIRQPYMVAMVQYRAREGKPGQSYNWMYAAALEPLDSRPQKVHIRKGGFPPGFELEKCQVHIYDRGLEIATNVAESRVLLTRDEAFQYVLIDYVSSHKGASLPANLAMGKLPPDMAGRLESGQSAPYLFVKVSKDGLPMETYADEACSHKVDDPSLLSAIRELRFTPALEKGRPVEGIALLKIGETKM